MLGHLLGEHRYGAQGRPARRLAALQRVGIVRLFRPPCALPGTPRDAPWAPFNRRFWRVRQDLATNQQMVRDRPLLKRSIAAIHTVGAAARKS